MAPRRRCPTCGSRQWHKEPASGLIACEEGHVLQNYRNEVNDAEDFGPHSMKKRALKSRKEKKGRGSQANPELYHGSRARYHYFECLQLLLRKQIAVLTEVWKLPAEFEMVCRDIWAMNMELLPEALPSDVRISPAANDEEHKDASSHEHRTSHSEVRQRIDNSGTSSEEDGGSEKNEGNQEEEDQEMEALLRENSESEDPSEDEPRSLDDLGKQLRPHIIKKARGHQLFEGPASTIATLVVGCWTLRIPVLLRDISLLIEQYKLPYLDPVARGILPDNMTRHLNKHSISALSPHHAPRTLVLHGIASRLCKHMYRSYGIFIPEVNASPILWRVTSDALCGTPMLYTLIKRVGQVLSLPLTLHFRISPGLKRLKNYDPDHHIYDNVPPEVAFLGTGIVVLKMIYGLDGRSRIPGDETDAACSLPRVDDFLNRLRTWEKEDHKSILFGSRHSNLCMSELDDQELDDYLGFSERALISKPSGDGLLERYFPSRTSISTGLEPQDLDHSATFFSDVQAVVSSASSSSLRPGEDYHIYRSRDVDGALPEPLQGIIERAARWSGVEEEFLGGVIETYERRILQFQTRIKV